MRGDLERRHQAGKHGVDVGAGQRELGRAEIEERMAERVDAIAVDVSNRPGGAHLEVAADQRHADGVPLAQRAVDGRGDPRRRRR